MGRDVQLAKKQQHRARWETGQAQEELCCSVKEDEPGANCNPSTGGGSPHWQWSSPTAPKSGTAGGITALASCPVTK